MKIVGIARTSFTPKDSDVPVEGMTIHTTEPFDPRRSGCEGVSTDHFFLSKNKLRDLTFSPAVGLEVEVLFNRYGKVQTLRLLSDAEAIDFGPVVD
jgi:hypothetical protein